MKPGKNWELFAGKEVAFILLAGCEEQCKTLRETERINETSDDCFIETGRISLEERVSNVHGLLTLKEVIFLEECAQALAKMFPKNLITWMTYCTNGGAWKYSKDIRIIEEQ